MTCNDPRATPRCYFCSLPVPKRRAHAHLLVCEFRPAWLRETP